MRKWNGMNWIWKTTRLAIYLRDGMSCVYCGDGFEDGIKFTLDHVDPAINGGSDSPENLVTCCKACNETKNDSSLGEYCEAMSIILGIDKWVLFDAVLDQISKDLQPFQEQAREIMRQRPTWQRALNKAHAVC